MGQISLPQKGMSSEDVLKTLKSFKSDDVKWHQGQLFGLIYEAGPEMEALVCARPCGSVANSKI
jgi:hypothetical protein